MEIIEVDNMEIIFECECSKRILGKDMGKHISDNGQLGHSHFRAVGTTHNHIIGGI